LKLFFSEKNIATCQEKIPCNSYKGFEKKRKKQTPKSLDFMENIFEIVKVSKIVKDMFHQIAKIYSDSKQFYFPL
jgi:hypothetical protein